MAMRFIVLSLVAYIAEAQDMFLPTASNERRLSEPLCEGASVGLRRDECANWMEIYKSCQGHTWSGCSNNLKDPCACNDLSKGHVKCAGHFIVEIFLRGWSLSPGSLQCQLPDALGNFINLRSIRMDGNTIYGTMPSNIGKLSRLEHLAMWKNRLEGTIPSELGSLSSLIEFDVQRNMLTGPIPNTLSQMHKLITWNTQSNKLSGTIPDAIGQMTSVEHIHMDGNSLMGTIPWSINNLTKLQDLTLADNDLRGPLPNISGLIALQRLTLWRNPRAHDACSVVQKNIVQLPSQCSDESGRRRRRQMVHCLCCDWCW